MFSYPEAARQLNAPLECPDLRVGCVGAAIDTRLLAAGELFVALHGPERDGHDYLTQAFQKGASGALINLSHAARVRRLASDSTVPIRNLIMVKDTACAFAALAEWYRSRFSIPCVGVTGSVGKTSTKEFFCYLLRRHFGERVLTSRDNFNNHLGLPLTLLRLDEGHRVCVAELGANHPGEIKALAKILCPTSGVITKISACHLEGFGSLDAIYRTKLELFENLPKGATAIIPSHDPELETKARVLNLRLIRVGTESSADFRVSEVCVAGGRVHFVLNDRWRFAFKGAAPFFAVNAAMALAGLQDLGISLDDVPEVWEDFELPKGRFSVIPLGEEIRVIYDGYNASPDAFEKALDAFADFPSAGRKILAFADMLELGRDEKAFHVSLADVIERSKIAYVLAFGPRSSATLEALKQKRPDLPSRHYEDASEMALFLEALLRKGDTVLLKASRGMKIDRVLERLQQSPRWVLAAQEV